MRTSGFLSVQQISKTDEIKQYPLVPQQYFSNFMKISVINGADKRIRRLQKQINCSYIFMRSIRKENGRKLHLSSKPKDSYVTCCLRPNNLNYLPQEFKILHLQEVVGSHYDHSWKGRANGRLLLKKWKDMGKETDAIDFMHYVKSKVFLLGTFANTTPSSFYFISLSDNGEKKQHKMYYILALLLRTLQRLKEQLIAPIFQAQQHARIDPLLDNSKFTHTHVPRVKTLASFMNTVAKGKHYILLPYKEARGAFLLNLPCSG